MAMAYRVSTTEAHLFCHWIPYSVPHCVCGGADVPKNWRTRPPERSLSVVLVQVISRRPLVTSPLSKRGEHGLSLESHKA